MNQLFRYFHSISIFCDRILDRYRHGNSRSERRRKTDSAKSRSNGSLKNGGTKDFSKMTLPEAAEELQKAAKDSPQAFIEALRELANKSDGKAPDTRGHSERVMRFSVEIAKILGLPEDEIERIRIAALIHDIGKITIEEEILNKPAVLTENEYAVMKTHPARGYELLQHIPQLKDIIQGMQFHHEQLDGTGYPYGLKGDEIPMIARIITVADFFDAMITIRPYRDPVPIEHVLEMIRSAAGIKYDEQVVDALVLGVRTGRIETRLKDRVPVKPES